VRTSAGERGSAACKQGGSDGAEKEFAGEHIVGDSNTRSETVW
jgi:hypothetical protein